MHILTYMRIPAKRRRASSSKVRRAQSGYLPMRRFAACVLRGWEIWTRNLWK